MGYGRHAALGLGLLSLFPSGWGCGSSGREEESATSLSSVGDAGTGPSATSGATQGDGEGDGGSGGPRLDIGPSLDVGGTVDGTTCDTVAELQSNQGCEFWAVDLPNVSDAALNTVPADQQFAVVVTNTSAEVTANVDIYVGSSDTPVQSSKVPVNTMRVFQLDPLNITPAATTSNGTAYRIESDIPITAYQFQPLDNTSPVYSNDATLLFPTHVLDGDYSAITGDATIVALDGFARDVNEGAFVSVVATRDDTTVTLFPTVSVHPGPIENVSLAKGQVLTAISNDFAAPRYGNLSGTRVVADKPVAVFSGSVATSEPSIDAQCCADHVEHQMLPLAAWGTEYVAAPTPAAQGGGNDPSMIRITGAFDGTQLEYDPAPPSGAPMTIGAYETVGFVTDAAFTVRSTDPDKPFAVGQFLLSNSYLGGLSRPGDPSMIILPAAAQFQSKYVFLMPQGYTTNFVTLVGPMSAEVTLDGSPVNAASSSIGSLDGTSYGYTHLSVEPGAHLIESTEPISIIVAGHSQDVSYGYAGGSGASVISMPPPPPG